MKTTLFEYLHNDYDKFPLTALVKQAKKFKDFKEFSNFYSNEIYHGYYWHLTKDKDFKYSINSGSRDMSSMLKIRLMVVYGYIAFGLLG